MEGRKKINVASFCFETMLHQRLHLYAGGLGVVQAGLLKSGANQNLPINLYGLGILWKQGYYNQKIGPEGMFAEYVSHHYDFLKDTGVRLVLPINGQMNTIKVWCLPPEIFGTAPLFLLDTDLEKNDVLARLITQELYGGNEETRLSQEIVLGIGGVRAFEALGIPIDVYHGQEGHTLLVATELLSKNLSSGMDLKEALEATKSRFVFTTHTPEFAGNEVHNLDLMLRMRCFSDIPKEVLLSLGGDPFDMTVAALRLARKTNAVSDLHLETTNKMWCWVEGSCPIISITNGVDLNWQMSGLAKASTSAELRQAKNKYKEGLIRYIKKKTGKILKKDILTIVWARRFTDYKRPWLIFMDWPWLEKLLQSDKLQLIIAGKPHPYDLRAINIFNDIYKRSLKIPNLVVLDGYEYGQSKILKAGTDIWLQTARRPREACGTSWISANLNGALVISSRDGGILESPEECHFFFGVNEPCRGEGEQDTADYFDLVRTVEVVGEMYYNHQEDFDAKALLAKQAAEKCFCSDRMLKEYIELMYLT